MEFESTKEGLVGVSVDMLAKSVLSLEDAEKAFRQWNNELVELRDLVAAEWCGGTADQFRGSYDQLAWSMEQMISCAKAFRDFSELSKDSFCKADNVESENVAMALRMNGAGIRA